MLKKLAKQLVGMLPAKTERQLRASYRHLRYQLQLNRAGRADIQRFRRRSGLIRPHERAVLQAHIIKSYHRVEKALALPNPRPGFGAHAVGLLLDEVAEFLNHFGNDHAVQAAMNTLDEYVRFNAQLNADVGGVTKRLAQLKGHPALQIATPAGGTKMVDAKTIRSTIPSDITSFFFSRYSVRQFSNQPVALGQIESAIRIAQKSPSVCNRESGHVFVVLKRQTIDQLLSFQNGNRGFGDQAQALLVVASRIDCFHTVGERYQHWIDGGMYAMSLVYGLHAQGLGACCLNWSVEPHEDRAFKQAAGIDDAYSVLMLIAVGHLPDQPFKVAQSPRRPIEEVMTLL